MNPLNNINMASSDMRLQQQQQTNFTSLHSSQYTTTAQAPSNASDLDLGDDSMIALVLGDLDFLNLMTENNQLQQQPVQGGFQQPTPGSGYGESRGAMNRGLSGVNLIDLHDEQSERIKSEVIGMNILNMTSTNSQYNTSSSATPAYLPQLSMNSTSSMLNDIGQIINSNNNNNSNADQQLTNGQLDPNFDFIFPDKSSKEILECLINDETDTFDSLFAPRIDYVNSSGSTSNNVNAVELSQPAAPLRSVSSQFAELFRMDNGSQQQYAMNSSMPKAPSNGKGKGKYVRADPQQSMPVTRTSVRLQSKRIVNCTKSEPVEPAEPVLMTPQPTRMMPGKLENFSPNQVSSYKRKRSYQDDDGSDLSNDVYGPARKHASSRELSQVNSMDSCSAAAADYDAENQMLLQQSSQLLAALQRQSRLTGNPRLSANMRDIERELQVLNSVKPPSVHSNASKGAPLDSRRSSFHSNADFNPNNNNNNDDDDSNPMKKDASNKDAAFRYRLKKLSEKDRLFETRELLERENGEVKRRIDLAQAEISYLKTLLVQMLLNKGYLDSSRVVS